MISLESYIATLDKDFTDRLDDNGWCALIGAFIGERWRSMARPNQLPGNGGIEWVFNLFMAGRGSGKTRSAAEWISESALIYPRTRYAIIAPTFNDARTICIEGESGILSIIPPGLVKSYNKTTGEIQLKNGSMLQIFTAEKPDRLRGPQFHRAWIDEPASLEDKGIDMWDMLTFCVRLPDISNHIFVTGTPKNVALMHHLLEECKKEPSKHILKTGSTLENKQNLSPQFISKIMDRYDGTNLGLQEIYGKMLGSVEGALWTPENIIHINDAPTNVHKRIISIDPAVSTSKKADLTGIIMASRIKKDVYIEKDWTRKVSPLKWAEFVIEMYYEHNCDAIIFEGNLAGSLIKDIFNEIEEANGVTVTPIRAKKRKQDRATPVAAYYQKGRVFHVGEHPELERQMTTWTPKDAKSPDRIDALVHAVTHLGLGGRPFSYGIPGK